MSNGIDFLKNLKINSNFTYSSNEYIYKKPLLRMERPFVDILAFILMLEQELN
mgnify:FL=1